MNDGGPVVWELVQCCPAFRDRLVASVENWILPTASCHCPQSSELSRFVAEKLRRVDYDTVPELFALAERLMNHCSQSVQDAVATCFLENLINISSDGTPDPSMFVWLLGPASRDCCRGWDEFTGARLRACDR